MPRNKGTLRRDARGIANTELALLGCVVALGVVGSAAYLRDEIGQTFWKQTEALGGAHSAAQSSGSLSSPAVSSPATSDPASSSPSTSGPGRTNTGSNGGDTGTVTPPPPPPPPPPPAQPVGATFVPPPARTYAAGDLLEFRIQYDGQVTVSGTPSLRLLLDPSATPVTVAGVPMGGSPITELDFAYTVRASDNDLDGVEIVGMDGANLITANGVQAQALTFPQMSGVLIDNAPKVASNAVPAARNYAVGENLTFSVSYNQAVNAVGARLPITIGPNGGGGRVVYASLLSGNGTSTLNFAYQVAAGDLDADGVQPASALDLNGGSILSAAGNVPAPTAVAWNPTSGVVITSNTVWSAAAPTTQARWSFSNGSATASTTADASTNTSAVWGSKVKPDDGTKRYFEVVVDIQPGPTQTAQVSSSSQQALGVRVALAPLGDATAGSGNFPWYGFPFATGKTVLGFTWDSAQDCLAVKGLSVFSANNDRCVTISQFAGKSLAPVVRDAVASGYTRTYTIRTTASSFTLGMPSGAVAWDGN